jgi:hypothetical protein
MPNLNLYASLQDYKTYAVARGQIANADANDDTVIVDLLEVASRYLDDKTGRQFYPSVETRLYDVPADSDLLLDGDLLALTTLTNGDAATVSAADYVLRPNNSTPYYKIRLKGDSSVDWEADSDNDTEQVISVLGVWGYREKYSQRAWMSVGTLGAAITDTTTLAFTMTAGHTATAGHILKIDSEILNVNTVSTNTVTPLARGDNGSTAATHLINATVYRWVPQEEVHNAVLEIAVNANARRFGKATGESATVTAAGVVLTPRDIPAMAEECIRTFARLV